VGLFSKKQSKYFKTDSPEEMERKSLDRQIESLFYPHTNETKYFLDLAFPKTVRISPYESDNWRPKTSTFLNPSETKTLLHDLKDQRISINQLTNLCFGFDSFGLFIDHVQQELRHSAVAATATTIKLLEEEKPSSEWLNYVQSGLIADNIVTWLEDVGDRTSTHSAVGMWNRVRIAELQPYNEAALIGFRTVSFVLNKNGLKLNIVNTPESGHQLVSDCMFFRGTAINPLEVINEKIREHVDHLIDRLDQQMKSMLGEMPTTENFILTSNPAPFKVSLMAAAKGGAMMACVGTDPSNCKFYERVDFVYKPQDPKERKWFRS
jgi:hypothetical protein